MAEPTSLPPDAAFPLDAVVGHEEAKLALRLAALDPLIGGVLLRGEKGSAKTTLARGLAVELGQAPFVELPLGATEDRVVGTLDTRAALTGGEIRFQPGLLAAAHGGVLYVDEINLLADHLVDILLDVAVSGRNVVERDGLSHRHPARFVLVGSMNPEEGELRPQLLDRFGLCVGVAAPTLLPERVEAVRRRLRFDRGQPAVAARSGTGWDGSAAVDSSAIDDTLVEAASRLALAVAAEGLRADLTLCRAAAALAAGTRGSAPEVEDLRRVAPLVLAHRSRRSPFDPPMIPPEALEQAMDESLHADADAGSSGKADIGERGSGPGGRDDDASRPGADRPIVVGSLRRPPAPSPHARRSASTDRGRQVSDRVAEPGDAVALGPTLRALAWRQSSISDAIGEADLRAVVRHQPRKQAIVMCVDLSGSMGASERAAAASGTVLGLLTSAYEQRCAVALVTFRGAHAEVVVEPTTSVEVARNRLGEFATGGTTPLADGLVKGFEVARRATGDDCQGVLVVLTDGRATGERGTDEALEVARRIAASGIDALVVDCETGPTRLGLARSLAEAMGAQHVHVSDLDPNSVTTVVRNHIWPSGVS
ncbi:MAG: ATP-binding protein [bacterium]|nr:ATP-binding protein [bacterium]MCY4272535.1 ATP-binding protein [bacterium]